MIDLEVHYPTIAKLKQVELDIDLNLNAYKDAHTNYLNNIKLGDLNKANDSLNQMDKINNDLITLLGSAEILMKQAYPKGQLDQEKAKNKLSDIMDLSKQLNNEAEQIKQMSEQLNDIEGTLSISNVTQRTNYFQYFVMFILSIVVIGLTAHTIITNETSNIENVVLILAVVAVAYYVYDRYFN